MARFLPQQHGLVLLACFLSLSTTALAQKKKPLPGYVVTMGGDTLRGAINPTDPVTQQYQVEFIPLQGAQWLSLDGYQLSSYTYYKDLDTVRFISLPFLQHGSSNLKRGFLQQIVAGEAQLYCYNSSLMLRSIESQNTVPTPTTTRRPSPVNLTPASFRFTYSSAAPDAKYPAFSPLKHRGFGRSPARTFVIHRENQNRLAQVTNWKFPQDAITYFGDCPELVADLKAGRYRYRDIPEIVRRYNGWHQAQKSAP